MNKLIRYIVMAVFLMIGCPWLAVTFSESAGMAMIICLMLFFAFNPLFSAVCGIFAGTNIKRFWALPIITSVLFLAGSWLFFEFGEPAFLLYGACYLVIGVTSMLISNFVKNRKK